MDLKKAKELIEDLSGKLEAFNEEYYINGQSSVDDNTYDIMMSQLIDLEESFPSLRSPNSPSQRVGGTPTDTFKNVQHKHPMLSLSNLYSEKDLKDWVTSIQNRLDQKEISAVCEIKIDGVAISVSFVDGQFSQAITRGNGEVGDDVSVNVKTIKNLPLSIDKGLTLDLRGEIFLPKERFNQINSYKKEKGEPEFKNPRNAAAGTVRMKDPKVVAQRGLDILLYDVVEGQTTKKHSENLDYLKAVGLPINPYRQKCQSSEEILEFCNDWQEKKNALPFEIDGVVIKLEDLDERDRLGFTSKSPRWATAWKFKAEKVSSRLLSVENSIGRTGTLTPVANLEPIQLLGTEVKRATLHNYDQISRLGIHHNDTVFVEKGGDIIPKIVGVDYTKRESSAKPIHAPENCPKCDSVLVKDEGEVDLRCTNRKCPAILAGNFEHFVSKKGMDIQFLGSSILQVLVEKGFISDLVDIYHLHKKRDELIKLDRFGEKSVDNLLKAIEASKTIGLNQFIYALGIRFIGEKAAKTIAATVKSLEDFLDLDLNVLEKLSDFGETMIDSTNSWINNEENRKLVKDLIAAGLNPSPVEIISNQPFQDKTIVITGTLSIPRNEWKAKLESQGFKVTGSVSKKTDYLLAGEKAGSKLKKANEFDVKILSEDDANRLIEQT